MNLAQLIDAIPVVQSTADRNNKFATPAADQRVFNKSTGNTERWDSGLGSWVVDSGGAQGALGWFNAKDATYGAKGDGATNDRAGLQAAATAAGVVGGVLYLAAAIFLVATQVYVPAGVTVLGAGRGVTIVRRKSASIANGDANNSGAVFMAGPSDGNLYTVGAHGAFLSYRDLTVDGNAAGNPGVTNPNLGCHGVRTHFVDDLQLVGVELKNCLSSGSYVWGCRRSLHSRCSSHNNGQIGVADSRNGIAITGPQDDATDRGAQDDHRVTQSDIYSNTDEGVSFGRNGRVAIVNNSIHDNGDMGIEGDSSTATADVTSVPAGAIIKGNHIYSNGTHGVGVSNANVQRVIVTNNILEDNAKCGVTSSFSSGSLLVVSGNIIRNWGTASAGDHGIIIGTFDRVVVTGNLLDGGAGTLSTGIVAIVQAATRHVTITGNQIVGAGGGGMSLTGSLTGTVGNNLVNGTVSAFTDGITIAATTGAIVDLDVHHNTVLGCVDDGFFIRTNGAANLTRLRLRNNTARGNGGDGVTFSEAGGGTITGLVYDANDFEGNTGSAITGLTAAMVAHFEVLPSVSGDRGDANVTVNPGLDDETQRFATALTANRTVTLGTGFKGAKFRVTRTGLGAFTLDVGGLKTIPAGTAAFVDVQHDGTAWRLAAYGTL